MAYAGLIIVSLGAHLDAFRGAVGKDLRVPLRVEERARKLRGPTRHGG